MHKKILTLTIAVAVMALVFRFTAKDAAAAPTPVYYSVGQNTTDHKTGSPTVTISNGLATFSVAQTASNLGVGDRVTYGSNRVAYISGRISSTQWTLVTRTGREPSNTNNATVSSIRHEFSSLWNAISYYATNSVTSPGNVFNSNHLDTANLVTGDYVLNIPLYYDTGPDTISGGDPWDIVLIDYVTTGPSNFIRIYTPNNTSNEVNQSQRHDGIWNSQKYNILFTPSDNFMSAIRTYVPYVKIDGLQIRINSDNNGNSALEGSYLNSGWIEFSNNIIAGQISSYAYGLASGFATSGTTLKFWNNLIYDLRGAPGMLSTGIRITNNSGTAYLYNNTIVNSPLGINVYGGLGVAKNNTVQDALSGYDGAGYSGNFSGQSRTNISNQFDAPGTGSKNLATVSFVNKAGKDFHLAPSDTVALNAGTDLSGDSNIPFFTDYDGENRFSGSLWDIGADEIFAPPPTISTTPSTVNGGGSVTVSWSSTGASSCTVTKNGAPFASGTSGSQSSGPLNSNTTFAITCDGAGGSSSSSALVAVLDTVPTVSNVAITEPDYCSAGPGGVVSWVYQDAENNPQVAYQAQIFTGAGALVYDSGRVSSSTTTTVIPQGQLQFNITYRGQVRAWQDASFVSNWTSQTICNGPGCQGGGTSWRTPQHAYPLVNFSWSPLKPLISQSITFSDSTTFYDGGGTHTWDWSAPNASPPNGNSAIYSTKYIFPGIYNVTNDVTDQDGYSCALSQPITIQKSIPIWKEVIVSLGLHKVLFALGLSF